MVVGYSLLAVPWGVYLMRQIAKFAPKRFCSADQSRKPQHIALGIGDSSVRNCSYGGSISRRRGSGGLLYCILLLGGGRYPFGNCSFE